jgi:hypothetical protein
LDLLTLVAVLEIEMPHVECLDLIHKGHVDGLLPYYP